MNLCTNAAYAMKDKDGILGVALHDIDIDAKHTAERHNLAPGNYVRLTVSDTGVGTPQRIKERIFDPFYCDKTKR